MFGLLFRCFCAMYLVGKGDIQACTKYFEQRVKAVSLKIFLFAFV